MKNYPDRRPPSAVNNWHTWSVLLCTAALVGLTGFTSHLDGVGSPRSGYSAMQDEAAPTGDSAGARDTGDTGIALPDGLPAMKCAQCGVVSSHREIVNAPGATELGPLHADTRKIYEVTVQLRNGKQHVFREFGSSIWRVGERMVLVGGV